MKTRKTFVLAACCILASSQLLAQDATAFYNEGLKLKDQKKAAEAAERFKKALALKSDYTEARYELGWCQNDLKQYDSAIVTLRKVREAWPSVPKVHFELGWALEKTEKYESAIVSYKKCIELKPDYSGAYRQLGYIYYTRDEYETALQQFRSFEKNWKDSSTDYLYYYRKGYSCNALKKYDSAIIALNASSKYKEDYLNTWLELGFAYTKLKKDDDAIANFKKAATIDPKSHIPINGIAEVYRDNKKDVNEAMNWYKKTLALNPTERKACFGMGYCLNSQQKFSEAIPYLRTAIEKEPTYVAAFVELGYSLYKTQAYTEAEEKLKKAISMNPKNENGRYYLGLLYITLKNKAKAQEMVNELRLLLSKHADELQKRVDAM